jgi:hypothetical protein
MTHVNKVQYVSLREIMRKKYFIKTVLVGLLLGIMVAGSAFCSTIMDEAEKLSWNTQNIGTLKALFPNAASVETFIKEVNPDIEVYFVYGGALVNTNSSILVIKEMLNY